jgi:hypothetical protein
VKKQGQKQGEGERQRRWQRCSEWLESRSGGKAGVRVEARMAEEAGKEGEGEEKETGK